MLNDERRLLVTLLFNSLLMIVSLLLAILADKWVILQSKLSLLLVLGCVLIAGLSYYIAHSREIRTLLRVVLLVESISFFMLLPYINS